MAEDQTNAAAPPSTEHRLAPAQRRSGAGPCQSCGTPQASFWSTPDGRAELCQPCATLFGFGCP